MHLNLLTFSTKPEPTATDKPRMKLPSALSVISIVLAAVALVAAIVYPLWLSHPAPYPTNYCNDTNLGQSYCSTFVTTNCSTPTGSLGTSSIECLNGSYDYLITVPGRNCGSEVANYFNIKTETGFSHPVSSQGTLSTYMSVAYNSTGVVTLAESANGGCTQSSTACLNYFKFASRTWSGFDCSFFGIGPTWTPTCYPFKVQLLNSSAILVSVVGVTNETYSRLKNGSILSPYVPSGTAGDPCL